MTDQHGLFVELDSADTGTSAQEARLALAGLMGRGPGGVVRTGAAVDDMTPIVVGTGAMSYQIRPFVLVTKFSDANGPVLVANRATQTVTTTVAPGTNPRIDSVYALNRHVSGDGMSGDDNDVIFGVVQGTANLIPAQPAVPTGAVRLRDFQVTPGAGSTSGLTATDPANFWTVANGGIIPDSKGASTGKVWNGTDWVSIGFGSTAWATPTPGPAANLSPAWGEPGTRYKREGSIVFLEVECQTTSGGGSGWLICTLPAGFRPSIRFSFALHNGSGTPYGWAEVNPDGTVTANQSVVSGGQVVGGVAFPIGA